LTEIPIKNFGFVKQDYTQLESIVEKDYEEKDDFKMKWNRYANLVQNALRDRK